MSKYINLPFSSETEDESPQKNSIDLTAQFDNVNLKPCKLDHSETSQSNELENNLFFSNDTDSRQSLKILNFIEKKKQNN